VLREEWSGRSPGIVSRQFRGDGLLTRPLRIAGLGKLDRRRWADLIPAAVEVAAQVAAADSPQRITVPSHRVGDVPFSTTQRDRASVPSDPRDLQRHRPGLRRLPGLLGAQRGFVNTSDRTPSLRAQARCSWLDISTPEWLA
jgi:hypothetical protein